MPTGKHGWLFRITWPVTHVIVTHISVLIGFILFAVFNRIKVIGKENIPQEKNTLLLSNHQSMIDSFLVGMCAFYPKVLFKPHLLPWNPAAEENFFRNPILAWFSYNWKCIPIKKGRKDVGAIYKMATCLKKGPMTLFPEGTRSRDGSIGKFRGGAGLLVLETQPKVVPVYIDGMNEVLPIKTILPRIFKKIYVYYGKPMDLSNYYQGAKAPEAAREIMDKVRDQMRIMRSEIQERKGEAKELSEKTFLESEKVYSFCKIFGRKFQVNML